METAESATREEGLRLLKAGQISDAIGILGKVVTTDPNDAQAHMLLGIACHQAGEGPRAAHHLEESIRLQESPKAYYNLGQVYEASNRLDDALLQYRRALVLDANYANAQEGIKRVEARTKPPPAPGPSLDQTQAMAGPPPQQTQVVPPPGAPNPYAPPAYGGPIGPPAFLARQMEEERKIKEAQRELLTNGVLYGAVCGAILFVLLGLLSAFISFAMVSPGSGIASIIISFVSGAIFGALVGLWMGFTNGNEMQGALAGAVLRMIYSLILGLIFHMPAAFVVLAMAWDAIIGGVLGMIIGKLVDASIGQI